MKGLWNRTLIERITIKGGQLAGVELKQLYHGFFLMASSNKRCLVGGPGLNPRPHGPEPYRWRVLGGPAGSSSVRLNSNSAAQRVLT